MLHALLVLSLAALSAGLTVPSGNAALKASATAAPAACGRREALVTSGAAALFGFATGGTGLGSAAFAEDEAPEAPAPPPPAPAVAREATTASGLKYRVVKAAPSKNGFKPVVGDLVAIRFKCVIQGKNNVIDDILANPEPYYYRVGSGQVLPAVEEAVVMMRAGDVWELEVPPALGFGTKGRQSSPGKPRISGDAVLDFTLELVAVPGKDEEIIDQNGLID